MKTDLTPAQCEKILVANQYAHLGCSSDGEPSVFPVTYVFRDNSIYGYTHAGHKIDILRGNPRACVQVEHVENGQTWESVMCWGAFEEITDAQEIQSIRLLLAEQHGKVILSESTMPISPMVKDLHTERSNDFNTGIIYCIKIDRMTGRSEKA